MENYKQRMENYKQLPLIPLFKIGKVRMSKHVKSLLAHPEGMEVFAGLVKHQTGDWGDILTNAEKDENRKSIWNKNGLVLSVRFVLGLDVVYATELSYEKIPITRINLVAEMNGDE